MPEGGREQMDFLKLFRRRANKTDTMLQQHRDKADEPVEDRSKDPDLEVARERSTRIRLRVLELERRILDGDHSRR